MCPSTGVPASSEQVSGDPVSVTKPSVLGKRLSYTGVGLVRDSVMVM